MRPDDDDDDDAGPNDLGGCTGKLGSCDEVARSTVGSVGLYSSGRM